jgi:hypothetical protein
MKWWKIARLVITAVRAAVEETKDAKDPASEGGKKVTPQEAMEIAAAVLASLVEPMAELLADK